MINRNTTIRQRIGLWFLLFWRQVFLYLNVLSLPILIVTIIKIGLGQAYFGYFNIIVFGYTFLSYPIRMLYIRIYSHNSLKQFDKYLLILLCMDLLENWWNLVISVYADMRFIIGNNRWVVTKRSNTVNV
jgi:hypothetical protein